MKHHTIHADNGAHGVLCIEREAGTAIILRSHPTLLSRLASIAEAQGTPPVRIMVNPTNKAMLKELEDEGWTATNLLVYERR